VIDGLQLREPATDQPDCAYCAAARVERVHGLFNSRCLGCVARHLADSPMAWRALRKHDGEDLAAAIREAWGDRYAEGRKAVWSWIQTLQALRATT